MKPFNFSLESLRTLRKQKERAAQQHYAHTLAACETAGAELRRAEADLTTGWNLLNHELQHGITAGRLAGFQTWCKALETRRNERKAFLDEAQHAVQLALQLLNHAAREREALDRFHDKSHRLHTRAVQREEQKIFDELAVQLNGTPGPLNFNTHKN